MISVIIPTLNEERTIYKVIKKIPKEIKGEKVEIIVVDGNSTDSTVEEAKKAGAKVLFERERGKGIAMRSGVKSSKGNKIVFIDGDDEYDPSHIERMIDIISDYDMAVGYRIGKGSGLFKNFQFNFISFFGKLLYRGFKTTDPITGLRAMKKRTWNELNLKSKNFLIETEMEIKSLERGLKIAEFPISYEMRKGSKFWKSYKDLFDIFMFLNKGFTRRIIRKSKAEVIKLYN